MWIASSLETIKTPTVIALGNFDGVHRGHQTVIAPVCQAALRFADAIPTVVTFCPHPQEYFTGRQRPLLTPISEKAACLQQLGIEQLVLVPFDRALCQLTPQDFVSQILVEALQARWISVGQDFRFGQQRSGTVVDLKQMAAAQDILVEVAALHLQQGERISSSTIRAALSQGNVQQANALLGRAYCLTGEVVSGQRLGRTIGFPTANLQLPAEKFLPLAGVYSVWAEWVEGAQSPVRQPAVMNLGYRPTVNGPVAEQLSVEVHLLDWAGDLYGQRLTISLEAFQRPEQKFASLEALKAQITQDAQQARRNLLGPTDSIIAGIAGATGHY